MIYIELYGNGVGGFAGESYWSSSESSATAAGRLYFFNGNQNAINKDLTPVRVRAVRTFIS